MRGSRSSKTIILIFLGSALGLTLAAASASGEEKVGNLGPYARLGLAIGWPNTGTDLSSGSTGAGLSFVGGYRVMDGVAGEVELVFTSGSQLETGGNAGGASATNLAFTVNVKGYPLEFVGKDLISRKIQPYAVFGLGGGSIGAGHTIGAFLVRFGAGVDWMVGGNWGVYADGSYYVTSKDIPSGYGNMTFGGIYRF